VREVEGGGRGGNWGRGVVVGLGKWLLAGAADEFIRGAERW
jgi:hypothetical protein